MKNFLMKIILQFLYRAIKVLNGKDSNITDELNCLPNGYKIKISTDLYDAKQMCVEILNNSPNKIKNNKQKIIKKCRYDVCCDLEIRFKNKHLAFKVFSGQISIAQAYAEHYFQMFGNINLAMGVTRIIERVEGYLFPKFINKKCLKRPIKRQISMFSTYFLCLFKGGD